MDPVRGLEHALQHRSKAGDEARFAPERLDHLDATQRFLEVRVHFSHGSSARALRIPDAQLEVAREDDERRQRHRRRERQHRAQDDHRGRDRYQAKEIRHQRGDAAREHRIQGIDVRRAPADGVAQRRVIEVARRQALQMTEQPHAQVAQDRPARRPPRGTRKRTRVPAPAPSRPDTGTPARAGLRYCRPRDDRRRSSG